jgi:hypothetical protein
MSREDILILLIEECGEVIQAATKCLRFGYEHFHPDYGVNCEVLAAEVGDLLGAVDGLDLDPAFIQPNRAAKLAKAGRVKAAVAILAALQAKETSK